MAAMQAQVEPHFLFNTLASIDHLIETDPPRASTMQKNLIALLRASMPSMRESNPAAHALGREMAVIRPYLEILKVRMEDRLQADDRRPRGPALGRVPADDDPVAGRERDQARPRAQGRGRHADGRGRDRRTARSRVTVADTGLGFGRADTAGTGIGLANIRERLKLLYGDKASMVVADNLPSGTVVTITVPYQALQRGRRTRVMKPSGRALAIALLVPTAVRRSADRGGVVRAAARRRHGHRPRPELLARRPARAADRGGLLHRRRGRRRRHRRRAGIVVGIGFGALGIAFGRLAVGRLARARAVAAPPDRLAALAPVPRTPGAGREREPMTTAVIADDERLLREQLRARLAEVWPALEIVAEARNGAEAVALTEKHRPDIVFLDIRMPGMTGIEAARAIAQLPFDDDAHDGEASASGDGAPWHGPEIVFITAYDHFAPWS